MSAFLKQAVYLLALVVPLVATKSLVAADIAPLKLEIDAGEWDRENTPLEVELPATTSFAPEILAKVSDGPVALQTMDGKTVQLERFGSGTEAHLRLTFVLDGVLPKHTRKIMVVNTTELSNPSPSWSIGEREPGILELKNRERTVFRYNSTPASHPNYGPIQRRDAYIHPVFTPAGELITGDFSKFHPHHRGFFLAYAHTQVGNLHPDFWNFHSGTGKISCDGLSVAKAGPVIAKFNTKHRWEVKGGQVVLREAWEVAAYDIPNQPYWLFDITASQVAENDPVEVQPYRYGGMAYRGAEPFFKGGIDVMTSDGAGRVDRDQKPARWADLTGPVADGSSEYGGAMIADHPGNVNHPTVVRIHPTTLPFFSYVPGYKTPFTINKDKPTVFRYRILIHDGHPDRERDERVWRDFAEPPRVSVLAS